MTGRSNSFRGFFIFDGKDSTESALLLDEDPKLSPEGQKQKKEHLKNILEKAMKAFHPKVIFHGFFIWRIHGTNGHLLTLRRIQGAGSNSRTLLFHSSQVF